MPHQGLMPGPKNLFRHVYPHFLILDFMRLYQGERMTGLALADSSKRKEVFDFDEADVFHF